MFTKYFIIFHCFITVIFFVTVFFFFFLPTQESFYSSPKIYVWDTEKSLPKFLLLLWFVAERKNKLWIHISLFNANFMYFLMCIHVCLSICSCRSHCISTYIQLQLGIWFSHIYKFIYIYTHTHIYIYVCECIKLWIHLYTKFIIR